MPSANRLSTPVGVELPGIRGHDVHRVQPGGGPRRHVGRHRAQPGRSGGRATGLGGRPRVTGAAHERARIAARKAISAAIERIGTVDEPLARHVRATVRTGTSCAYEPGPDDTVDWALD